MLNISPGTDAAAELCVVAAKDAPSNMQMSRLKNSRERKRPPSATVLWGMREWKNSRTTKMLVSIVCTVRKPSAAHRVLQTDDTSSWHTLLMMSEDRISHRLVQQARAAEKEHQADAGQHHLHHAEPICTQSKLSGLGEKLI